MRAVFFCLCLCLLGTVLPTPVSIILLKGCNTNHGFFVFKFMHSFMRRNQTQVKKEEGDHQGTIHGRWLGKVDGETLGQGVGSSHVPEDKDSPKPHSHITPVSKVGGRALRPSTGDSISVYPTSTSMEGSGDMGSMLLGEIINGEDGLPQSTRPGEPHGDGNGGNGVTPGDGAVTAGRERATDSEGAGGEGSSHATVPDQGQAGTMVTGDSAITSVTKKEDVHVDAEDIGEFAYIPYVDAATITRGQDGETHVSPKDEVQIFIGRANIQVGENDGSAGSTGATSEANVIPAAVNARPQGYPEESTSMVTVHHGDSATSRPGDHPSAGNSGDGATANHSGQELEAPSPQESTDGEATVTTAAGSQSGKGRSGQRPVGKHSLPATMTTQGARGTASSGLTMGDCSTAVSTPPEKGSQVATAGQEGSREVGTAGPKRQRARIQQEVAPAPDVEGGMVVPEGHGARTQPGVSSAPSTMETEAPERHRSRAQQGVAPVHSMERETVTPERQRARMQPGSARMQPGSARLGQAARPEVAPAPSTAGGIVAPEGHRARVWPGAAPAPGVIRVARPAPSRVYNGDKRDAMGKSTDVPRDPWVWGSTSPQTQHTRGSMVAGSFSHLHGGQRMGSLAELERSRQVEQVRQADRLRLHERALYGLSGVGGPLQPLAAQADSWSADSSQSSEGQWGSRSNSGEEDGEVRGYPHRRRSF
uniref:Ovocleidin-116-like n=1 Tax=Coturnix japonica TaxID=93934 RepID=A0A8C2TFA9_COTJA